MPIGSCLTVVSQFPKILRLWRLIGREKARMERAPATQVSEHLALYFAQVMSEDIVMSDRAESAMSVCIFKFAVF